MELPKLRLLLLISGLCFLSSAILGLHISAVNLPRTLIQDFINGSFQDHYGYAPSLHTIDVIYGVTSSILVGALLPSALVSPYIMNRWGRKAVLVFVYSITSLVGCATVIGSKYANSFELLILARLILGLALGFVLSPLAVYTAECSPSRFRGMMGSLQSIFIGAGSLLGVAINSGSAMGTDSLWPYGFTLFPLVASVAMLLLNRLIPESPMFLLMRGHTAETKEVLRSLHGHQEVEKTLLEIGQDLKAASSTASFVETFRNKAARRAMLVGFLTNTVVGTCGLVAMQAFSSLVLRSAGFDDSPALTGITLGLQAISLVFIAISAAIVDRFGRRVMLFASSGACAVTLVAIAACLIVGRNSEEHDTTSIAVPILMLVYFGSFSFGAGTVPLFVSAELSVTTYRPTVSAVSITGQNIAALITVSLYPVLQELIGGYAILVLFVGPLCLTCLTLYFILPETKGRKAEEIAKAMCSGRNFPGPGRETEC